MHKIAPTLPAPALPAAAAPRRLLTRRRIVGAGAAAMLALASRRGHAAPLTLKLAHVAPPTSAYQSAAVRFKEQLLRLSGGAMDVDIIPGGALGPAPQLWAQVRTGSLDMHLIDVLALEILREGRMFGIMWMPWLYRDQAHWRAYLRSDVAREMMAGVEKETGIRYVGHVGDRSPRALTTRAKRVETLDDLRGLKIRTPESPALVQVFRAWGAAPTAIRASELYTALQTGLVDGQEIGMIDVVAAGYVEVQKFYTALDYMHNGIAVFASGKRWESLTPQQRGWVDEAARLADQQGIPVYQQELEASFATARSKGMTIVEKVDREPFRKAAQPVVDELDGKLWPKGLYERIAAIR